MIGLNCDTITGRLVIGGVSMHTPAWCATDLTALWVETAVRGSDRLLPHVDGVKAYPRRIHVTEHSLPLLIAGDVDQDGTVWPNRWVGLETNLAYLTSNVVDPPGGATGTRAATLTMPSGAVRTADIHILALRLGEPLAADPEEGAVFAATLEISIPAGRFE